MGKCQLKSSGPGGIPFRRVAKIRTATPLKASARTVAQPLSGHGLDVSVRRNPKPQACSDAAHTVSGFSGCTCDKMAGQKMFWAQQEGWGTKRPERNRTRKHLRTGKYIIPGYGRRQPFTQASPDAGIIASTAHAAANKTETRAAHDATQAGVTPNAALPFLRKFKA
jgi:hypothetical protein